MTLYNEIEPYAADWLRNLVASGHVAPGEVDARSIRELREGDVQQHVQAHFFAGIGVWSHALRSAGWPDARPVWTGSCPCQPFSSAGRRGGEADDRHLWPEWFRLIRECRPPVVLGEQVASPDGLRWLDLVSADLEGSGYAIGAADLCAAGVGAPHIRQRLYFVAVADGERLEGIGVQLREGGARRAEHEARRGREAGSVAHPASGAGDGWIRGIPGEDLGRESARAPGQRDASQGSLGDVAHAGGDERGPRRSGKAHGSGSEQSTGLGDACIVGDPGSARGRGDAREVPRAESGSGREREPARSLAHEPEPASADGPTSGFWRDIEWLPCQDGRVRPVEPGTFPLAHGVANRVGKLRAYGNALCAPLATRFVEAVMQVI